MNARLLRGLICTLLTPLCTGQPLVWFCPLDPLLRVEVGYSGSPEYMQLFSPDAPWNTASSRVNVFKIYPQWINAATDADLRRQFADLDRRGIALALEYGVLSESADCGRGVEGFGGRTLLNAVRRIQRLGGKLRFVGMDEPVFFSTLYKGRNACGWTLEQMAQNAAANINATLAEFPDVQIGEIEPFPVDDVSKIWREQYAAGLDAFRSALGFPLAFFHADILWTNDRWPAAIADMRAAAAARGIPFGVIYNGDPGDQSSARWLATADAHMTEYELQADSPDQVIFQSWHTYPKKLLPDTDLDSFSSLINRYFRPRPGMTLTYADGAAAGSLSLGADSPISGATVALTATPLSGDGFESDYVLEGVAPAGARQIVFGARVNLECGCSAPSDFSLRCFRLETPGDAAIQRDFSAGLQGWGISDRSLATLSGGRLRVRAAADQSLLINSAPLAFAREDTPFRLIVRAQVNPKSAGSGYFALIFLADREISRGRIPIRAADRSLGETSTSENGSFRFSVPPLGPDDWLLRAAFRGSDDLWPARADVVR